MWPMLIEMTSVKIGPGMGLRMGIYGLDDGACCNKRRYVCCVTYIEAYKLIYSSLFRRMTVNNIKQEQKR